MDNKKRRYEFETKVKVPDMDEIRKAAGQFADPPEQTDIIDKKTIPGAREAAQKSHKNLMNNELSSIKDQLEELASEVVMEEQRQIKEALRAKEEAERLEAEAQTEAEQQLGSKEEAEASEAIAEDVNLQEEDSEEARNAEKTTLPSKPFSKSKNKHDK